MLGRVKAILIVDDELAVAEAFAILLTAEGYRTQIAGHGKEALTLMEEFHPDLVISDVMMPVMDGHALMRAMSERPELSKVPVLLMSAAPAFARDAPLDGPIRLQKPFDMQVLLDVISQMLAPRVITGRPR